MNMVPRKWPRHWLKVGACAAALVMSAHAGAAETVKIGFIDLLSGPFALTGQSSLNQLREVVAQVWKTAAGASTWRAMVRTFAPAKLSRVESKAMVPVDSVCWKPSRSKKKGSSEGPAKTEPEAPAFTTATGPWATTVPPWTACTPKAPEPSEPKRIRYALSATLSPSVSRWNV